MRTPNLLRPLSFAVSYVTNMVTDKSFKKEYLICVIVFILKHRRYKEIVDNECTDCR